MSNTTVKTMTNQKLAATLISMGFDRGVMSTDKSKFTQHIKTTNNASLAITVHIKHDFWSSKPNSWVIEGFTITTKKFKSDCFTPTFGGADIHTEGLAHLSNIINRLEQLQADFEV